MDFTFIDLFGEKDIRFLISKSPRQLSDQFQELVGARILVRFTSLASHGFPLKSFGLFGVYQSIQWLLTNSNHFCKGIVRIY